MCGFAGFLSHPGGGQAADPALAAAMASRLAHRGPDDEGTWAEGPAALAHRRLAILDLSAAGHQPMVSACGRFVVAFNGEIYNHLSVRTELGKAGHAPGWRGHSDTETLLAAIAAWGLSGALTRFHGMFAFALWDRRERVLHLARDRMGEKPLYYGFAGQTFLFGSELKALRAHPDWVGGIDRAALGLFMRYCYVPAPRSIYEGVFKLPAGCTFSLTEGDHRNRHLPAPTAYWSLRQVAETGLGAPFRADPGALADELDRLLRASIRGQMISDVPLGAFLSGGIDSSLVVALMQAESSQPVRTFSIGFEEREYNEADHAAAVARHLGTHHTELYVTARQALDDIPRLPEIYDEPFGDASQIPTHLVSRLARDHVTVALSGDGGDELFGGYSRYFWGHTLMTRAARLPDFARHAAVTGLRALRPATWNRVFAGVRWALPRRFRHRNPGERLHRLAQALADDSPHAIYLRLLSHWHEPNSVVLGTVEPPSAANDPSRWLASSDFWQHMMYVDTVSYLPDDILVKVDRAAMAESLETRIPFLDHDIVEFAWHLPLDMKMREGQGKYLLRQVLYKYVPRSLLDRPKMGFGVPLNHWLRGPLRDWAESLLDPARLRREGYLDPAPVRARWEAHVSGQADWQYPLWDVLMFQAWLEHQATT